MSLCRLPEVAGPLTYLPFPLLSALFTLDRLPRFGSSSTRNKYLNRQRMALCCSVLAPPLRWRTAMNVVSVKNIVVDVFKQYPQMNLIIKWGKRPPSGTMEQYNKLSENVYAKSWLEQAAILGKY
ncbi:hypothetical protein GPALN_003353 [Globodera pallida]|nr:hypothetical protein GPALN_003353 [Globodera pallida]